MAMPSQEKCGGYGMSVGAAWVALTSASFKNAQVTPVAALGASLQFTRFTVTNTHATQSVYVLLFGATDEATTDALLVPAGKSLDFDVSRIQVTAIAIQGSGAATTGGITAWFRA